MRIDLFELVGVRYVTCAQYDVPQRRGYTEVTVRMIVMDTMESGPFASQAMAETFMVDHEVTEAVSDISERHAAGQ